ncbi:MAG: hypothetical protein Q9187_009614, partial [Circinaria calcarea]
INVVNVTQTPSKRDLSKRVTACGGEGILVLTLNDGILLDAQQRVGSIVANRQFQFDGPPQAGAVYTGGWSNCPNGTLAIGGSAIFYQCLSGDFNNLYDQSIGGQCTPVYINTVPCVQTSGSGSATAAPVTSSTDTPTSTPSAIAIPPSLSNSPITTVSVSTTSAVYNSSSAASTSTVIVTTPYANTTLSTTAAPITQTSASGSAPAGSATESITPFPSNAAGILAKNNEFIALAAGVAALVMI